MRRILCLVLAFLCVTSLAACEAKEKAHSSTYEYMVARASGATPPTATPNSITADDLDSLSADDLDLWRIQVDNAIAMRNGAQSGKVYAYFDDSRQVVLSELPLEELEWIRDYIAPLPDSDIMFLGIPWGTPEDDAVEIAKQHFPDINTVEREVRPDHNIKSSNFSDPNGEIIAALSTPAVETVLVTLENRSTGQFSSSHPIGSVAGHTISAIFLYFVKVDEEYHLYEAAYAFNESADMGSLEQYSDLQAKMTALYGEPKTYSYDTSDVFETTNLCCVWMSDDNSAAYLEYTFYLSGSYLLDGSGYVWLHYGTTDYNDYFFTSDQEYTDKIESDHQDRINEIASDNSGL